MRLIFLMVVATLATAPAAGQSAPPSSPGATARQSAAGDQDVDKAGPVSLDRIREGLARSSFKPLDLRIADNDVQVDYKIGIQQALPIERFFSPEDFKAGPVPFGGVYAHEMQRVMNNPNRNPLAQPYAGFTGGEFAQVAATSVLFDLVAKYLTRGLGEFARASEERAAREEVARAIREYCAAQPGGGAHIEICTR
jgi:hypothetical protein